jgi:hypothetical protein
MPQFYAASALFLLSLPHGFAVPLAADSGALPGVLPGTLAAALPDALPNALPEATPQSLPDFQLLNATSSVDAATLPTAGDVSVQAIPAALAASDLPEAPTLQSFGASTIPGGVIAAPDVPVVPGPSLPSLPTTEMSDLGTPVVPGNLPSFDSLEPNLGDGTFAGVPQNDLTAPVSSPVALGVGAGTLTDALGELPTADAAVPAVPTNAIFIDPILSPVVGPTSVLANLPVLGSAFPAYQDLPEALPEAVPEALSEASPSTLPATPEAISEALSGAPLHLNQSSFTELLQRISTVISSFFNVLPDKPIVPLTTLPLATISQSGTSLKSRDAAAVPEPSVLPAATLLSLVETLTDIAFGLLKAAHLINDKVPDAPGTAAGITTNLPTPSLGPSRIRRQTHDRDMPNTDPLTSATRPNPLTRLFLPLLRLADELLRNIPVASTASQVTPHEALSALSKRDLATLEPAQAFEILQNLISLALKLVSTVPLPTSVAADAIPLGTALGNIAKRDLTSLDPSVAFDIVKQVLNLLSGILSNIPIVGDAPDIVPIETILSAAEGLSKRDASITPSIAFGILKQILTLATTLVQSIPVVADIVGESPLNTIAPKVPINSSTSDLPLGELADGSDNTVITSLFTTVTNLLGNALKFTNIPAANAVTSTLPGVPLPIASGLPVGPATLASKLPINPLTVANSLPVNPAILAPKIPAIPLVPFSNPPLIPSPLTSKIPVEPAILPNIVPLGSGVVARGGPLRARQVLGGLGGVAGLIKPVTGVVSTVPVGVPVSGVSNPLVALPLLPVNGAPSTNTLPLALPLNVVTAPLSNIAAPLALHSVIPAPLQSPAGPVLNSALPVLSNVGSSVNAVAVPPALSSLLPAPLQGVAGPILNSANPVLNNVGSSVNAVAVPPALSSLLPAPLQGAAGPVLSSVNPVLNNVGSSVNAVAMPPALSSLLPAPLQSATKPVLNGALPVLSNVGSSFNAVAVPPALSSLLPAPLQSAAGPVLNSVIPVLSNIGSSFDAPAPVGNFAIPSTNFPKPVGSVAIPVSGGLGPVIVAAESALPVASPLLSALAPIQSAIAPLQSALAPVQSALTPVTGALSPILNTTAPVLAAIKPVTNIPLSIIQQLVDLLNTLLGVKIPVVKREAIMPEKRQEVTQAYIKKFIEDWHTTGAEMANLSTSAVDSLMQEFLEPSASPAPIPYLEQFPKRFRRFVREYFVFAQLMNDAPTEDKVDILRAMFDSSSLTRPDKRKMRRGDRYGVGEDGLPDEGVTLDDADKFGADGFEALFGPSGSLDPLDLANWKPSVENVAAASGDENAVPSASADKLSGEHTDDADDGVLDVDESGVDRGIDAHADELADGASRFVL